MAPTDFTESSETTRPRHGEEFLQHGATWLARRERWLWIGATIALVADVVTTLVGLQVGLAEGNPLVANTLETFGAPGFFTIKAGVLVLAYGARVVLPQYRVAIPLGIALPWAVIAISNAALLLAIA